ncbi:MAG: hypothetical protein EZS28_024684, partial [Streblomastix strix]
GYQPNTCQVVPVEKSSFDSFTQLISVKIQELETVDPDRKFLYQTFVPSQTEQSDEDTDLKAQIDVITQEQSLLQLISVVLMKCNASNLSGDNPITSDPNPNLKNVNIKRSPYIYAVNGAVVLSSTTISEIQLDNVAAIYLIGVEDIDDPSESKITRNEDEDVTIELKKLIMDNVSSIAGVTQTETSTNGSPTCIQYQSSFKFERGKLQIQGKSWIVDLGNGALYIGPYSDVDIESTVVFEGNSPNRFQNGSIFGSQRKNILCYGGIDEDGLWIFTDEFCDVQVSDYNNMTAQSLIFTPTLTKVDGSENKKGWGMDITLQGDKLVQCALIWIEICDTKGKTEYKQKYSVSQEEMCLRVLLENVNPEEIKWNDEQTQIQLINMPYDGHAFRKSRQVRIRLLFSDGKPNTDSQIKQRIAKILKAKEEQEDQSSSNSYLDHTIYGDDGEEEFWTILLATEGFNLQTGGWLSWGVNQI